MILVLTIVSNAHAERLGPKDVEPVIFDGVKYVAVHWGQARGLDQNGGYVEAFDLKTNKSLWLLRIYKITYDVREKDIQDVFITKMSMEHGALKVANEKGEMFSVDPATRLVTKVSK